MSTWPRVPYWGGYWNWGRPLIPLPSYIVLTDRATGALLNIGQTGSVGSLSVLLVPWDGTIRQPATVFGPQDGPYLNGHARLYSQNGTLAVEDTSPPAGIYDHRVFTRDGAFGRHLLEITLTEPLTLTYTEINT
jgi:hypothetical protein